MAIPSISADEAMARASDSLQAAYFRGVLADQRAVLGDKIEKRTRKLSALSGKTEALAINRLRREIRANEAEYLDLDRMIQALDRRFAPHRANSR